MEENSSQIFGLAKILASRLKTRYPPPENENIARILAEEVTGTPWISLRLNPLRNFTQDIITAFYSAQKRLLDGEPLQYVLEKAWFYGLTLRVSPAVLIPRPETEGLLDWTHTLYNKEAPLRILDACTGSGCIALAARHTFPHATVMGADLSDAALDIARANAAALRLPVAFSRHDFLSPAPAAFPHLDLILSNPPYVLPSEAPAILPHVLRHEPHLALFVPADDPLCFYRALLRSGRDWLLPGGRILFEINAAMGTGMHRLMRDEGYTECEIRPDSQGRDRYAGARWPGLP